MMPAAKHTPPGRGRSELLTWITTRGDWEKYHSGMPNRLMSAVLVSCVSEQRVLRMLPPGSRGLSQGGAGLGPLGQPPPQPHLVQV